MKQGLLKVLLLIFFSGISAIAGVAQVVKYHRIEAAISKERFAELMKDGLGIDHYEYKNGILKADVSDEDIRLMKRRNISIKYVIEDLEKNLYAHNAKVDKEAASSPKSTMRTVPTPSNFGAGGSYGTTGGVAKHFTFQEMQNELDEMRALYPGLITVKSSIGTTEQGRQLYMVKISDNPEVDEDEPEIFLTAVHHAREPISMTQLIFFMWHALENYNTDKEIQTLLNSSEIYIVLCVNPDGYVYNTTVSPTGGSMWRKNRRNNGNGSYGVDNNRNYGFRWGGGGSSGNTSSETYRGPAPFSELENRAIRDFANSRQFVSEFNYHSHGNYLIYPYSAVAVNDNPEIPLFRQLSVFLTEDNNFVYGNCQETLNYIADGEANDWGYGEQTTKGKMYGFTPEIGTSSDGFYPAASRIIPLCNSMTVMNYNLLKVSTKYGLVTTNAPATVSTLQGSIPFSIKNFSIYPATYTVTVTSSSPFVTSIDGAKTIASSTIFQTQNNLFNYILSPTTPEGTVLNFTVSTNNGYHTRTDEISIVYTCIAPGGTATTGITASSANVSWAPLSGFTSYYLSMKPASAFTWGTETLVTGTSSSFTNLAAGTAYNWRVRSISCANYSATQNFTTLVQCNTPSPAASSITSSGFTLTWPAIIGATSYTVQTRLQGTSTWSASTVSTNSRVVTGLSPSRTYEFQVRANCISGASPFSALQTVTTTYCAVKGSNNNSEWIDYIQLGSITRTSGKEIGGYVNTGLSTTLVRNRSYTITFSAGFSSSVRKEFWDVYIDYNQDGDFNDNGEHEIAVNKTGAGNFTASFSVPSTAALSTTTMRVVMNRSKKKVVCGTFEYGEVEDYAINITTGTQQENRSGNDPIVLSKSSNISELSAGASPNPFTDQVRINLPGRNAKQTNVILRNALGIAVYKQTLGVGIKNHIIKTSHLPGGIYYLIIENDKNRQVIKLVK